jgi:quinol monooxygenase YgiN
MVKHIVFWKLKESAEGRDRSANAQLVRERLEGLAGRIPGLLKIEVGLDFLRGDTSSDLVLYSELANRQALDDYQAHPEHQAVIPLIRALTSERRSVDYEV